MGNHNHPPLALAAIIAASTALPAKGVLTPQPAFTIQALRAQEGYRASQIQNALVANKEGYGLGAHDALVPTSQFTDNYGDTHVHFQQTYRGVKVWGSHAIGHMDVGGAVKPAHASLLPNITLPGGPQLDEARIKALAAKELPDAPHTFPMRIEQVVFPARYQDGLKVARSGKDGLVLDERFSVATPRLKDAYAWAYHVSVRQDAGQGPVATELIIDGRTGYVLKKWDGLVHASAPGHSQYNGDVTVNSVDRGDGTFLLRDTTRPTQPWPLVTDPYCPESLKGIGILPITGGIFWPSVFTNGSNVWGDGLTFDAFGAQSNSETAAVDALYGTQVTWDYYQNVHGRPGGIDGQGSSPILDIHHYTFGNDPSMRYNNAYWDPYNFLMAFGDGAETGSLTSLDVTAHELSHGVFSYTASLYYTGEGAAVNEANSDIHATMAKFYQWSAGGTGSIIPNVMTASADGDNDALHAWTIGSQISNTKAPFRWLYKPSLDGISYDAWFDGVGLDDSHFSMGPGNRVFYFLAQGSASDATSDLYSPYLPGGMAGLGNDKAAKIWFHGMTTKLADPTSDYHAVREAMIASATELYDAAAVAAVKNAFAAINIGAPASGPEPVTVKLRIDPIVEANFRDTHLIVVPTTIPTPLPAPEVTGTTDTSVAWSLGGFSFVPTGGKILDGGVFLSPVVPGVSGAWPVTVTSHADSKRFAVAIVLPYALDTDSDTETDALDLGPLALGLDTGANGSAYPGSDVTGQGRGVTSLTVAIFLDGFANAFGR